MELGLHRRILGFGQRLAAPDQLLPAAVELHAAAEELRHVGTEGGPEVILAGARNPAPDGQPRSGLPRPQRGGKTTTIRLLLGLIRATSGRAEIFGVDCQADPVAAHRFLTFVPGDVSLWPSLTGTETLHLLGRVHGHVDGAYRDALLERFEFDPSKKVRAYSKGNRQKLVLIAALMTRADLLLLDEPTSGLDPLMEKAFQECVAEARDRGQTVFLSSHILQ
ncbi:MAG: ABC transporter ATP-binding protein [Actinobacteria bacterium]|nr:ABC transporter ATP-binding protein [Actinomycetota bacterium]